MFKYGNEYSNNRTTNGEVRINKKGGECLLSMVGMRRLELPTPTSRTWCASQLRYIPEEGVGVGVGVGSVGAGEGVGVNSGVQR